MSSKIRLLNLMTGLILFQVFFPFSAGAQGSLLITPRRLVFEEGKKSMDLNLANIGDDTATYAISLIEISMKEDGSFEAITDPADGQLFASPFLRYFPRSVTLGPEEVQTVKVQLIRGGNLAEGEYRSHFYFRAVPDQKPLGEEPKETQDPSSISVVLTPVFGITIPVIIRVGQSSASVTISDLKLVYENDTVPRISLNFNRSGNFSVYGDLAVDHISPAGTVSRIGIANGVAVYTPNIKRHFEFDLVKAPLTDLGQGRLKVTFSSPSDVRPEKYCEAELVLR